MISAAWRRAPCTNTPASVSGGMPPDTEAGVIPSPYLLENTDAGLVTVAQVEVSIERRRPWARPLRPFDEHDGAFARHVLKPDIPGLVGRLEAITIDVVDGGGTSFIVMHQRVSGTRRQRPGSQAAANRLHQGRLARPQLAREPDDGRGCQVAAQRLTEPVEV